METSDVIQIIATFITGITAIISVIIAVKSLKITQKSIEDANKPIVVCYLDSVDIGYYQQYFIIKNFGKTPAVITDITFENLQQEVGMNNLESFKGTLIAPNQKFVISMHDNDDTRQDFSVTVRYKDQNEKGIKEVFHLNPNFTKDISYVESSLSSLSKEANQLNILHHNNVKNNL
ncbi:hypothetical protein HCB21_03065 [Listeria booriae]|uniref:hypothetical protein n=1 Tax=Listeria booriae TaxID=1552123 RepID=UPI00162A5D14|nr:hypothetical protein [Listeria booriae]MBC1233152.1 hypothetical protein [Listeria booriae]MBC2158736.1 hypothetical protein [Listeria booriae]